MGNKGLCETCVHDKECTFSRRFPVIECEEFSDHESTEEKTGNSADKKI